MRASLVVQWLRICFHCRECALILGWENFTCSELWSKEKKNFFLNNIMGVCNALNFQRLSHERSETMINFLLNEVGPSCQIASYGFKKTTLKFCFLIVKFFFQLKQH